MTTEALAFRHTPAELVRIYDEETDAIRKAAARIEAAQERLGATFSHDNKSIRLVHDRGGLYLSEHEVERMLLRLRHEVWGAIIARLGVRRMMSHKRAAQLDEDLKHQRMPEITERSIAELVDGFASNLGTMLEEAVEEVFDWLRPRAFNGHEYKTNSQYEVPGKVILQYIVEVWGKYVSNWRVSYGGHADQMLTSLENVFSALDGKGQITKTHYSTISTLIRTEGFAGAGETPYFKFKTFQNGNMHLEFRRKDLLEKFNRIAGGRRLRKASEAAE